MTTDSKIEWTHHTFNPWWGCTKVSPGCDHCYAETFARRVGQRVWGKDAPRRTFGEKHWAEPLKWNKTAAAAGERHRVFCASMADVFEGRPEDQAQRLRLWRLIMDTPSLDWLLLTKRPGAILPLLRSDWANADEAGKGFLLVEWLLRWANGAPPANVWLGTTVEDQHRADERIEKLRRVPAVLRFLSVEPLLERVDLDLLLDEDQVDVETADPKVDWVIVGGESGPGARPCDVGWVRSVITQCRAADIPVFVKQLGAVPVSDDLDDKRHCDAVMIDGPIQMRLRDRKGGRMSEWPEDLQVREFAKGGAA